MSHDDDRAFQLLIWGYCVEGDVCEHDARLAEGDEFRMTQWDRTRSEMSNARIDRGNGWEPLPDWWALQHLPMDWREVQHSNDG